MASHVTRPPNTGDLAQPAATAQSASLACAPSAGSAATPTQRRATAGSGASKHRSANSDGRLASRNKVPPPLPLPPPPLPLPPPLQQQPTEVALSPVYVGTVLSPTGCYFSYITYPSNQTIATPVNMLEGRKPSATSVARPPELPVNRPLQLGPFQQPVQSPLALFSPAKWSATSPSVPLSGNLPSPVYIWPDNAPSMSNIWRRGGKRQPTLHQLQQLPPIATTTSSNVDRCSADDDTPQPQSPASTSSDHNQYGRKQQQQQKDDVCVRPAGVRELRRASSSTEVAMQSYRMLELSTSEPPSPTGNVFTGPQGQQYTKFDQALQMALAEQHSKQAGGNLSNETIYEQMYRLCLHQQWQQQQQQQQSQLQQQREAFAYLQSLAAVTTAGGAQGGTRLSPIQNNNNLVPGMDQLALHGMSNEPSQSPFDNNNMGCGGAHVGRGPNGTSIEFVWHSTFEQLFAPFGDQWTLRPLQKSEPEPDNWHKYVDAAKVRFICQNERCPNAWTSMRGKIVFWYLPPRAAAGSTQLLPGQVVFRLTGQKCGMCKIDKFQDPLWYPEEVVKVLSNLRVIVARTVYGYAVPRGAVIKGSARPQRRQLQFGQRSETPQPIGDRSNASPAATEDGASQLGVPLAPAARPHKSELCQACAAGICESSLARSRSAQPPAAETLGVDDQRDRAASFTATGIKAELLTLP